MAKICEICKKGTTTGNNIRHKETGGWALKAPRTGRKLLPNLRTLKVQTENGSVGTIKVCMKCYKRMRAE